MGLSMTSLAAQDLTEVADGVIVRAMYTIERAIEDFLADGQARGWPEATTIRTYKRTLHALADRFPPGTDVAKITSDDLRAFRATRQRKGLAASTIANEESHLSSFTGWLLANGKIKQNPMVAVARTRRPRAEDVDVVSVSTADVLHLLDEARPGREQNTVAIAAYLGARRTAIARLKLDDYTSRPGALRFQEKGKKTIWKVVPVELAAILDASIARGDILPAPNDYLVPPGRSISAPVRDSTVIWTTIKQVAARAGIVTHVHALRAAFACFYLETNPGDLVGLSESLGHTSLAMTMVYLRRLERDTRMAPLRSLSWDRARAVMEPGAGGVEGIVRQTPVLSQRVQTDDENGAAGQEVGLTAPGSATAQPSLPTVTSLTGDPVTERFPVETRLPRDDVTMRAPRQLPSDDLVDDLLGALLRGERVE